MTNVSCNDHVFDTTLRRTKEDVLIKLLFGLPARDFYLKTT